MSTESAFIDMLRQIARHEGARNLSDDAALLAIGGQTLVLTHDMLIEGVHYRSDDPPEDVGWKLVSVNFSDLAGKGAEPLACLMGFGLSDDPGWERDFIAGIREALDVYGGALIGGDTVRQPPGDARALGLSAIGTSALASPPARSGARPGDLLYCTGCIGDGWAGLQLLEQSGGALSLVSAYRRPYAQLEAGRVLAPLVHAMMDISDGLLIDARHIAVASGVGIEIELADMPLSDDFIAHFGDGADARISAATGGDDYQLLLAAAPDCALPGELTLIGRCTDAQGLELRYRGNVLPLPARLGWQHG